MSQKNIKTFINELYSKPPRKYYATNKTVVYHIDDIWSLDILDLKDYGLEKIEITDIFLLSKTIFQNLDGQYLSKIKLLKQ